MIQQHAARPRCDNPLVCACSERQKWYKPRRCRQLSLDPDLHSHLDLSSFHNSRGQDRTLIIRGEVSAGTQPPSLLPHTPHTLLRQRIKIHIECGKSEPVLISKSEEATSNPKLGPTKQEGAVQTSHCHPQVENCGLLLKNSFAFQISHSRSTLRGRGRVHLLWNESYLTGICCVVHRG